MPNPHTFTGDPFLFYISSYSILFNIERRLNRIFSENDTTRITQTVPAISNDTDVLYEV